MENQNYIQIFGNVSNIKKVILNVSKKKKLKKKLKVLKNMI